MPDYDYKGRIFGRSVTDVRFRAFYGEDLFLGELLVGADAERGRRYLFRVTDVAYGSESSDDGWAERVAGGLMEMDRANEPTGMRDVERRLYKVAKVASLGYVDAAGRFHKPKSLPAQFGEVSAPTEEDLEFLRVRMGDVEVGRLRSGEDTIDLPVGIRGETLPSHVGVFATTGMGKSNLMKVLAGQLLAASGRYAMLVFDPHGEYLEGGGPPNRGLAHHPWAEQRLRVYSPSPRAGQASLLRLPLMTEDPSQSLTCKVLDDLAGGKVVLVDTSGLEAVEEMLVASLLTRSQLEERASAYCADRDRFAQLPRTLVALEEAQRVLTRLEDAEFNVFPRLAREGRKFNVGMCAVTQQPKLIDAELLSQFNTYFVLGLADERDRHILRQSSKQDLSDLGAEIQTLMPGEGLVTNPEAPFALPARVHLYEDWLATVPEPERPRPRPAGSLV